MTNWSRILRRCTTTTASSRHWRIRPAGTCSTGSSSVTAARSPSSSRTFEMTRFGVMKHLRVLEDAGLVVTRRAGREKHHFLNPVPIRLIHDRWIDKYTERGVSALARPQERPGGDSMTHHDARRPCRSTSCSSRRPRSRSGRRSRRPSSRRSTSTVRGSTIDAGRSLSRRARDGSESWGDSEVLEWDPPRRLVHGWQSALRPRARERSDEPRDLGDRAARTAALTMLTRRARPARGRAEDRGERLRRRLDAWC